MHTGEAGLTPRELHERLRGKQGIVVLLGDRLDPPAIDAGADLKVIANVAVGYDNLDVALRTLEGDRVHQHAGRADRRGRRLHVGA